MYRVSKARKRFRARPEAWLHTDDETVSKAGHEDVFRVYEDKPAVDRGAYINMGP